MSYHAHGDPKEFYAVTAEAFLYLINKIRALKVDDHIIGHLKRELIIEDLEEEAQRIEDIAKEFEKIHSRPRDSTRVEAELESEEKISNDNKQLICHALTLYYHDLNESKTKMLERLGLGTTASASSSNRENPSPSSSAFRLKKLDELIEKVKKYKDSFCGSNTASHQEKRSSTIR
jgi:hypothetical protein